MKRGREGHAQCETEKQPDPQTNDSSENPSRIALTESFLVTACKGTDQGGFAGLELLRRSIR